DAIPLYQYVIVFLIVVFFISFLNYISKKFNFFRAVAIGNHIPIIKKGRFIMENITEKKNKIDILNITSRLHSQGIHYFQEVNYSQIEPDGQITVVCDGAKMHSIIIM
ncbi:YetF domain-containing protein, partial [Proteus mirabilis]|uniref:YetF domain-containing protein n=1 Tax=Proteus mirabilis TaxID=584 RepID=UPI00313E17DA